ncbi:glycosyltransferase family 2 protein [Natrinema halophilum]|uniref:Glycosyltransferase family 2 protein n=1 Tax=Natrinema halophilum TaxID=1699371 RepID=A0A7D5KTQ1_9EURY|nr:glycosyltransferase family 2 protein [Natrinema halophilum]QLG50764.1 glycosyltransferase family 2 protein [Natrinema halophilum]
MYRRHTIGVIVPAYNEEGHIGDVLATIPDFVDRIYAVDDHSVDGTWRIIQEYAAASRQADEGTDETDAYETSERIRTSLPDGGAVVGSKIVPIRHTENKGAGGALRTGYIHARDDGVDIAVTMDADGQMDPDQLPTLLDPIVEGDADYAKGNRLADQLSRREMPPFRLFGNWLLTQLTKIASGYWRLQDPQNGYTAISHEALSAVDIESLPDDHDYPNDLLVRLNIAGMRVADVSMPAVYDDEESTIEYRTFVPLTSVTLLRGFCRRMWAQFATDRRHPAVICYTSGITALASAVAITSISVMNVINGEPSVREPMAAVFTFLASAGLLLVAMQVDARDNAKMGVRR